MPFILKVYEDLVQNCQMRATDLIHNSKWQDKLGGIIEEEKTCFILMYTKDPATKEHNL